MRVRPWVTGASFASKLSGSPKRPPATGPSGSPPPYGNVPKVRERERFAERLTVRSPARPDQVPCV
jgi:hypothetical protein